jgi:streptomycin 3"-adenylyltransferase
VALYGWPDCPVAVREQIDRLSSALASILSEHLGGIYLHGSLAMGCFNPRHSDLDLLVIAANPISLSTKRQIVEYLLVCSQQPRPIEISLLAHSQLHPWRYPTPFDLHYSEMWRDSYTRDLAAGTWQAWNTGQRHDPDLAAHITVINARGICLAGEPIAAVFPAVPADDYRASLAGDIHDSLESIAGDPVYAILNCCRTYAYIRDGRILSKEEGGRWALGALPAGFRATVASALAAYRSATEDQHFEPGALIAFAASMRQLLAPVLQQRAPA